MTPIMGHPEFLPVYSDIILHVWVKQGVLRAKKFLAGWIELSTIAAKCIWRQYQLSNCWHFLPKPQHFLRKLLPFEEVCQATGVFRHSVSHSYQLHMDIQYICRLTLDFLLNGKGTYSSHSLKIRGVEAVHMTLCLDRADWPCAVHMHSPPPARRKKQPLAIYCTPN